jgi:hypothetical protein
MLLIYQETFKIGWFDLVNSLELEDFYQVSDICDYTVSTVKWIENRANLIIFLLYHLPGLIPEIHMGLQIL